MRIRQPFFMESLSTTLMRETAITDLTMRFLQTFVRRFFAGAILASVAVPLQAQATGSTTPSGGHYILLWPEGAPLAHGTTDADKPRLTVFVPKNQTTRTGIVVLPGGGYSHLAYEKEGTLFAQWLNNLGITAFVLEYRHAPEYHYPAPILDGQRAIRYVRAHAAEYNLASDRIGVFGFSAGGHLAATTGTHCDEGNPAAPDTVDRISSRPDFLILGYPVIAPLAPAAASSFTNLLGENPDPKLVAEMTPDLHVTPQTPPTFLVLANDDAAVSPENSIRFYMALLKAHVPAEMHIYQHGGHGFGMAALDPALSSWTGRLQDWLRVRSYLSDK
jgi:acetyl esterase/lipase